MAGRFRIGIFLTAISLLASTVVAFATYLADRTIAFLFGIDLRPWQPSAEGFGGFLLPSPAGHPIDPALYQSNRHEAHSHARAAHRGC